MTDISVCFCVYM